MEADDKQDKPGRRGRPPKALVKSKTQGSRGVGRGRPKGDAAIINDYKAKMLSSPRSKRVLDTILNAALDDDHKHQSAAWKLVMDRIAPVAAFEKDIIKSGSRNAIQINITGIGEASANTNQPNAMDDDFAVIDGDVVKENTMKGE